LAARWNILTSNTNIKEHNHSFLRPSALLEYQRRKWLSATCWFCKIQRNEAPGHGYACRLECRAIYVSWCRDFTDALVGCREVVGCCSGQDEMVRLRTPCKDPATAEWRAMELSSKINWQIEHY
jgi:hypothetical protein